MYCFHCPLLLSPEATYCNAKHDGGKQHEAFARGSILTVVLLGSVNEFFRVMMEAADGEVVDGSKSEESSDMPTQPDAFRERRNEEAMTQPQVGLIEFSNSAKSISIQSPPFVADLLNVGRTNGESNVESTTGFSGRTESTNHDVIQRKEVSLHPEGTGDEKCVHSLQSVTDIASMNGLELDKGPASLRLSLVDASAEAASDTATPPRGSAESTSEPRAVSPQILPQSEEPSPYVIMPQSSSVEATSMDNISDDSLKKISFLEAELHKAQAYIETLLAQQNASSGGEEALVALKSDLQQQLSFQAEAENKVRLAEGKFEEMGQTIAMQAEEILKFERIEENLQQQMAAKVEAENKARSAYDRVQQLESDKVQNVNDLTTMGKRIIVERQTLATREEELEKVRLERDEVERKVMVLTTRLNAAKKKEAVKVNLVEEFEDDLKAALEELETTKKELKDAVAAKSSLEQMLDYTEKTSQERIDHLENLLAHEKRLNDERKTKMKGFVEMKAAELRQAKEDSHSLQVELTQTNRSLVDLNNRWKQLHNQWVQAQTRNREIQRDLNRIKKDSETLHKQGDTLEMKLSRSANETEEHKNKRLAAKHELMSVLRALDAEREVTAKLREKIKFSLTPIVLSQQKVLKESLEEFEASLLKLSFRLGKPLPLPPIDPQHGEPVEGSLSAYGFATSDSNFNAHLDISPLVEKFEHECHLVSQAVTTVAGNVERLQALLHASGDRTCFTVLSELVTTGTMASSPAIQEERAAITGGLSSIGRSHRYGQVPGAAES